MHWHCTLRQHLVRNSVTLCEEYWSAMRLLLLAKYAHQLQCANIRPQGFFSWTARSCGSLHLWESAE